MLDPAKRYQDYVGRAEARAVERAKRGMPPEERPVLTEKEWRVRWRLHRGEPAVTFEEWLAEQSDRTKGLVGDLITTQMRLGSRPGVKVSTRLDKHGRTWHVVRAQLGEHESLESHEHALALFVDAHRVAAEDLEENYLRVRDALKRTDAGRAKIAERAYRIRLGRINIGREPHPEDDVQDAAGRHAGIAVAAEMAAAIRHADQALTGEQRDAAFLRELERLEREVAQTGAAEEAERARRAAEPPRGPP